MKLVSYQAICTTDWRYRTPVCR